MFSYIHGYLPSLVFWMEMVSPPEPGGSVVLALAGLTFLTVWSVRGL